MAHVGSTGAVMVENYRAFRQEIRDRQQQMLQAGQPAQHESESDQGPSLIPIRSSPLWKRYCDRESNDPQATTGPLPSDTCASRKLGPNYIPEEETIRNDYSQHFVDSGCGVLPASAVRNPSIESRFIEYPKLRKLVEIHGQLVELIAHPPTYLKADLLQSLAPATRFDPAVDPSHHFHLNHLLPIKYDVVLIDPPLESYQWEAAPTAPSLNASGCGPKHLKSAGAFWSWDQIANLPVPQLVAKESFIFLWVGSGARNGLERGRELLSRWGFRRCEDICWLAIDPETEADTLKGNNFQSSTSSGLTRTVQHCLMGIRGTVRRSNDTNFVHCNIDTDVILWPPEKGADRLISKPPELYNLIENFCLGTRRIELFGRNRNLRRGWLTVGAEVGPGFAGWSKSQGHLRAQAVPYQKSTYDSHFRIDPPGCDLKDRQNVVPFSTETDALRPKSPMPRGAGMNSISLVRGNALTPGSRGISPMHSPGLNSDVNLTPEADLNSPKSRLGGAGLSGLGAGGPKTVSVQSGSETLSGPQASVLGLKGAPIRSGPSGLGRTVH
ncbi:MT-A70-domain-containing protein [Tilletiaria anomala UBC 951]|uniref:MT-A70-domain-containing protein n=1 Tax=Tilletiaria anomala (strain ATCC 24038 / CBS 436.72 / UBC 951) TaxID=1037660 RepID=A0A066VCR9_TILAU|nr:MT-A70-domain-containing protein [Tilletiaria anomala UBC 951]KDN39256.1 MT-A70-domain-containing protein [Tilletiaria anomala UBC 951]